MTTGKMELQTLEITQATAGTNNTAKINPLLKTIFFTPGETTGSEDIFDASGNMVVDATKLAKKDKVERWGLPFILVGDPGVSKTSVIKQNAKLMGLKCVTLIASLCDPTDFRGIPTIAAIKHDDPNGKIRRYKGTETVVATGREPIYDYDLNPGDLRVAGEVFQPKRGEPIHSFDGSIKRKKKIVHISRTAVPEIFTKIAEFGDCVLFLDEFSTASPAVQAALLRPALDLVVGDFKLPGTTRVVAAMNPVDQAANGSDLSAPLANRFGHYYFNRPSTEQWANWMVSGSVGSIVPVLNKDAEQQRVLSLWDNAFAKAKGLVCSFILRRGSDILFKLPSKDNDKASAAWPSPRSWSMATRALAGAAIHGLSEIETHDLVAAFVGLDATKEFIHFMKEMDLQDPSAILDGKEVFKHDTKRLDRTVATLNAMVAVMANKPKDNDIDAKVLFKKRTIKVWEILLQIHTISPDVVVSAASILTTITIINDAPAALALIHKLSDFITAAEWKPQS